MALKQNATNDKSSKLSSEDCIALERKHGAHNYHPIPVVIEKGLGCKVWDIEGKEYFDYLSGYSAVSQGHCHPDIIAALTEQASKLTLTSRAFHNDVMAKYTKFITEMFKYDKVLPMNSGAEGGETAVKLCRKWAYKVKKVPHDKAVIVFCHNNFWGRTIAACSSSSDPSCYENYGPYTPGFKLIEYNNIAALEKALEDPNVAGFYVEPVQGEAGVIVPSSGYLQKAFELCKAKNVLFIADEIQAGLGRCGTMLASDFDKVRPDIVILGKALSGGTLPVSAVLADDKVMLCMEPGTHGSTYGGNPLACAVAMVALQVLKRENLCERAALLGVRFRSFMRSQKISWIKEVRGRGLLNAVEVDGTMVDPWNVCLVLAEHGILTKPTHKTNIRFAPPLIMTDEQMEESLKLIGEAFKKVGSN